MSGLVFLMEHPVSNASACLHALGPDLPAYGCLECMDSTTVMCANCFFNSCHVDHLYWVFFGIEGHCDCGNTTAVLRENCCQLHYGPDAGEIVFTPKQFHTYFSAAHRFLASYLRRKYKPSLCKLVNKPLTLRSLSLASLFAKNDEAFLMQNYRNLEMLYAHLARHKQDLLGYSFAARLCRSNQRGLLEFLLYDQYFRVLGIAVIQQMIAEQRAAIPGVSTLAARVITESKAIPVFCQSGVVHDLMRCLSIFKSKIWKPAYSALYYLKPLNNPLVYVTMLRSNFLVDCFSLYYKIVSEFKLVPSQLCENHELFFQQFREHLHVINVYDQLFNVAEMTWIRTDASDEQYRTYYIGRNGAAEITIPADDYTNSDAFEYLVRLSVEIFGRESLFDLQQFVFLPNVLMHVIILNFVLKVGVPAEYVIYDLAYRLYCGWQTLLQFLCDTLLYSLVPIIKYSLDYFKQYQFELSTVLNNSCFDSVEKYYHIALRFLQLYLPFVSCKLSIFARHLDTSDCKVLIGATNMICFLPQQENLLKYAISKYAMQTENFTVSYLFEKFRSHRTVLKYTIEELFERIPDANPTESMHLRLRTTDYFEPALSIYQYDEILSAFQIKHSTSALIKLAYRYAFYLDTKTLITPDITEFFDDTYVNNYLPVSLRFAVLRLLGAVGYKSSNSFQSTDPLLRVLEKQIFLYKPVEQTPQIKLTARMAKLKVQRQIYQTDYIQLASPPPTQDCKPENDVCGLCHEAMGDDVCILVMIIQRHGFTFPHSCPHRYHTSCCDKLECRCAICEFEFQFLVSRSSLRYFYSEFPKIILLDVDAAFLTKEATAQIVKFKDPLPRQLMMLPSSSFLFEKAIEATTQFAVFIVHLADITHEHKKYLIYSLELVIRQLMPYIKQPCELSSFPSEADFSERQTLVTKSVFPENLSTMLRYLDCPVRCSQCKAVTQEWFVCLKENKQLCMNCVVETNIFWDVSRGNLIFFLKTFHIPYRSIYGEVCKTMSGFERHFDPILLENIIFSTLSW